MVARERWLDRAVPVLLRIAAFLVVTGVGAAGQPGSAQAQVLEEALAQAYATNPALDAARAELRSTDEGVPIARGARRPSVAIVGDLGASWTESSTTQKFTRTTPRSLGIQADQPLYRGGSIDAGIREAENQVRSQRAALLDTEQSVLLAAVTAYSDVLRDQALVELNRNNERVLERQLEATNDRFRVGEITRTDVSQAEQRLSRATADRIQAQGNLEASRATYERVVGRRPLRLRPPDLRLDLPASLDAAIAVARDRNPAVLAALYGEAAARDAIDRIEGELWPQADLSLSFRRTEESSFPDTHANTGSIIASVTIPLYTSGSVAARARQARQVASQRRLEINNAVRQAQEQAIRAWQALVTARASIVAQNAQIRAAQIALDGVRQEALVGARTVLDVLDAEQELLNSRVSLVQSQRDEVVANYTLLSAVGRLTAQELRLDVPFFDYQGYYRRVRGRWFGTDTE